MSDLKVRDIDSDRMLIHVEGGKGRDVMLSPSLFRTFADAPRQDTLEEVAEETAVANPRVGGSTSAPAPAPC